MLEITATGVLEHRIYSMLGVHTLKMLAFFLSTIVS